MQATLKKLKKEIRDAVGVRYSAVRIKFHLASDASPKVYGEPSQRINRYRFKLSTRYILVGMYHPIVTKYCAIDPELFKEILANEETFDPAVTSFS